MTHSLRIQAGRDRDGVAEGFGTMELATGDLVALVGPTGSGKSRFLADIEWLSEGDSPSGRRVSLTSDDATDSVESDPHRRVAQLSQSMQFTLDLEVGPFLALHAKARAVADPDRTVADVIEAACTLCGEAFGPSTHLSCLSGGQSRALMIADTAILAAAPVVLVDEVENAGVDRRKAVALLTGSGKIVLMATHDPLLALTAGRRLVFAAGAVAAVIATSPEEKTSLAALAQADAKLAALRESLRRGGSLCFSQEK